MVSIQLGPEAEQRLRELATEQGVRAESLARNLLERCLAVSAPTSTPRVSAQEASLLQEINRGLAPETWQRYHQLMERRREETLSPDEHEELVALTDTVELAHAARMKGVAELANLRGISIDDLMAELGIGEPQDG